MEKHRARMCKTEEPDRAEMPSLRIGSRGSQLALWQAKLMALLSARGHKHARTAKTIMERLFSLFERIRRMRSCHRSTLVLLEWGFGEYYQCGYWAALENRGSRLLAAARGPNPLLSAALRDPREVKTCLTRAWFLTDPSPNGTLKVVLKRGTAPIFQGGLMSRLSFLRNIPPRIVQHA
jgi:hypothetical protein